MKKIFVFFIMFYSSLSAVLAQTDENVRQIRTAAERGDAEAQCFLGVLYSEGNGVSQSNAEAVKWFRKSAEKDCAAAQLFMGYFYFAGNSEVSQDKNTALAWFEKSYRNWDNMSAEMEQLLARQEVTKSKLEQLIGELKTPEPEPEPEPASATYLSTGATDVSFTASGGTKTVTVSTDGSSYEVRYLPGWCSVSKSSGYFTLVCEGNTGDARASWFKVKSDDREVRIEVSQSAGVKLPSAKIESISVNHNIMSGFNKGMNIHVKFSVDGMLGKQGNISVWFASANGTKLLDYNGQYRTSDGQVSVWNTFKPTYESAIYNDFVLFMPYSELHMAKGFHNLKFNVGIFDHNSKQLAYSGDEFFTFSW